MDRRQILGLAAAGSTGLLTLGGNAARAHDDQHEGHHHDEHLRILGDCIRACNEASHHCLEELKKSQSEHREHHAMAHELALDCQEFCVLAARLMVRHSPLVVYAHQSCAEACHACAAECEKGTDDVMKACAEKCRECETMCREMAKKHTG
ncbi:four-helix bundle copper-binding protein [Aquisphaera insulae]|uniref:four-helix bundle copper-binding protein n=1 Tax=Aquisphaera insulae TaxID=2712864 RepID=UPI0013E9C615|nr:four-helix bundle copper-binding protein [Aquisphaera insulae]